MSTTPSEGSKKAMGIVTIVVIIVLLGFSLRACSNGSEQAEALTPVVSTTVTTETLAPSTTVQEVEETTTTTKLVPDVVEEQLVVIDDSFKPTAPPKIKKPSSIAVNSDIKAGTAQVVLRSSRLIDESGSRDELTFKYNVDFIGNFSGEALFDDDPTGYKKRVYLPSAQITIEVVPSETFEWDGQVETYPAQVVEVLSDGTVGEPRALPADAAIAFKSGGVYQLSAPIQTLLFRAAESSSECIAAARNTMRRIFMEAVYVGYENDGTSRELIEEVEVPEKIQVHEFSAAGIEKEMLELGGGAWSEFELVSVTCGG